MNETPSPEEKKTGRRRSLLIILIIIALAAALIIGLKLGKSSNKRTSSVTNPPSNSAKTSNTNSKISSLISYQLPDGWNSVGCNNPTEVILIVPQGKVSPDCASLADNWPMKIMMDPMNTTECSQIKVNNQQITNHVCSSQTINGSKIFVASTTYNEKSDYGKNTKVSDYYVDTSNGVVKLEYADDLTSNEDDYQAQFDQIANSIKVK
jgi:hypothetical protein